MSVTVPSGYKQTKVGVIPEDWEIVKLRDICTFYSGGTPTSTNKEYYNGNIPFIGSGNINDTHVKQFITQEALNTSSAKLVNKGDLLYALYGATSGEVAISKISGAINQAILCIRSKENLYFLYQFFLLKKNKIIATFLQGGQGNLSAAIIKNLIIPLPLLKEQQKIAQILTTWDDAISKQENLIKAKETLKKGLMQKLLSGEVRFEGEWKQISLVDIASRITTKNTDSSVDMIFTNSALNGIVIQNEFFDKDIANRDNLTGYYIVEGGDFVYNPRISKFAPCGPINRNRYDFSGIVSPLYTVFRINENEVNKYFEYFFSSTLWFRYMKAIANYGARHDRMNISNKDFMKMPIPYPTKEEQEKIAQILTTADKEIELLKKELETLKEQKRGLMQRLLTGKVRTLKIKEKE